MNVNLVVDNSAFIEMVIGITAGKQLAGRLAAGGAAAPELLDAEALNVIRRMRLRAEISQDQATTALRRVEQAPIARMPHRPLLRRAWELRSAVSAYDALYLALAEALSVPLITCDRKLAGSNGHRTTIECYSTS